MGGCESINFPKVAVIGVGLIGGSLAISLREKALAETIIGLGRGEANLKKAVALGVIDSYTFDAKEAVEDADLIIVAVPVVASIPIIKDILPLIKQGAIITDVGSVKGALIREVESSPMPQGVNLVWAHPIAGTEFSGVEAAFSGLYEHKRCILTPTENTTRDALNTVTLMWEAIGAKVSLMDAVTHDAVLASVSHLPHVAAFALVNAIAEMDTNRGGVLDFSAGGFRDFTRIASSSPEMWADICSLNKEAILGVIDTFMEKLSTLRHLIEHNERDSLVEKFEKAKGVRDSLVSRDNKGD